MMEHKHKFQLANIKYEGEYTILYVCECGAVKKLKGFEI